MPDWSYHVLFKPWLKKLSTKASREFIHKNMNRIASLPGGSGFIHFLGREEISDRLHTSINGLPFSGPVGLAGKMDPQLSGTKAFSQLGFGFIEIGPVTLEEERRPLYPKRRLANRTIAFPARGESIGLQKTLDHLVRDNISQPLLFHLKGSQEEIMHLAGQLQPYEGFYSISYQQMKRELHPTDLMLLNEYKPLYVRVPSHLVEDVQLEDELKWLSGIILEEQAGEDTVINKENHKHSLKKYPGLHKITVGGIREPADAIELLDEGADLLLLSGEYIDTGPGLPKRIYEALIDEKGEREVPDTGWNWYFIFGLSILLGGLLALMFSLTSVILPYDEHFLGMTREELLLFNERMIWFMKHDRMTLAGTMISGGFIYMMLAGFGVRHGLRWARQAIDFAAITGFAGILFFIGYGYFDWLHLLFWLVLLPMYMTGAIQSRGLKETPSSPNRKNSRAWKLGVYGQFCLVVLGFAFVLGGIIISVIGVSSVFIPTDIQYLCMPPEMIQAFNERLIPVVAHDRAGFGSALISVGSLVLMAALWGFHEGKRWLWWMFLIGGIPAFAAGIFVHIMIGYTTFTHLLPAYIALGLYGSGLILSFSYLTKR
ncbi:dihydroorotate dehydrogenase [Halobacillus sp. H74]|uniref:dihydroorotate dehydrogenase n=1 Tax=Halobacillus sp. H74 TaxID=3457436 RepID=UPI003FCCAE08